MSGNKTGIDKIAFVIFAQDESSVIHQTVVNILGTTRPSDTLFIVSDNSSDDTALIAEQAGARVIIRESNAPHGKGAALAWFMNTYQSTITGYDCVVILDADSLIPEDFTDQLSKVWSSEISAAQCFLQPIGFKDSPLSTLIALSEIVEQTVFDSIRSFLGLSVRLRGTGMIFTPSFLLKLCPKIGTEVEDIVLSMLVSEQKIKIQAIKSVVVFDPKPVDRNAASRQRGRWFRGQRTAFWTHKDLVFKLVMRGPAGWFMLSSLFFKPRWIKLFFLITLGIAFLWVPFLSIICFAMAGIEILLILAGTLIHPERMRFLKSLVHLPGFIFMWIKGIFYSLRRGPWLRVRIRSTKENYVTQGSHSSISSVNLH